jgi:hypothetical protein
MSKSRLALLALLLALLAPSLAAQAPTPAPGTAPAIRWSPPAEAWQRLAPSAPPVVAAAVDPINETVTSMAQRRGSRPPGVALMIVGGAGILTGLLVDEDIITIAGAGVAGVGLYLYLR